MNTFSNARSLLLMGLLAILCSGCAIGKSETPVRIALLAPFEGRYREIGYDALYAARLALLDTGRLDIELLAVDDGGSIQTAAERARALARDPRTVAAVVLGYDATDTQVQQAFGNLPVIIVGEWLVDSQSENIRIFSNPDIPAQLSYAERLDVTDAVRVEVPFAGGEVFALRGFRAIRQDFQGITVVTSGVIADDAFRTRIAAIDQFAQDPGLLATNVYSVVRIVINTNQQEPNWQYPTQHKYTLNTKGYPSTPTTP